MPSSEHQILTVNSAMHIRLDGPFPSLALVALLFAAGCNSRPTCVPVSGKVQIDGEALKCGAVIFIPNGGRQSSGIIDANGQFKLTCFEPDDGALPGTHRIQIYPNESINATTMKWHAPKKYINPETSGLTQEIKGSTDSIVIDLTWKGNTPDKPFIEMSETDAGEEAFAKRRRKK
jgi:hypothetical protein